MLGKNTFIFMFLIISSFILFTSIANSEQTHNKNLPILLTADELKFDDELQISDEAKDFITKVNKYFNLIFF